MCVYSCMEPEQEQNSWQYTVRFPYSGQKKKVNGPEGAKYFSPVERGKFFLAPLYYGRSFPVYPLVRSWYPKQVGNEAELRYQYNLGKKN